MVAVYGSIAEAQAHQVKTSNKKYVAAIAASWLTLVVAAVLIVGNTQSSNELIQTQLAFKEFEPERNVMKEFDAGFTEPAWKQGYDLMKEGNWKEININSEKNPDVTEGVVDPYADQSPRIKVPEIIYTQDPPYKTNVVEIGEHTLGEPYHEYTHAEEGEAVMGKVYEDKPFDKTINSTPEKNPSREWKVLDVDNEPNPNY